jgi:uncharacterized protein
MIHPNTAIKFINETIGYGVFATADIMEGTIVYVQDELEIVLNLPEYQKLQPKIKTEVDKYAYIDAQGNRIVSWDFAKFVNHCCNCNTISTGYGFEIAVRDIFKGEQITDDYGAFNLENEMPIFCGEENCRKKIRSTDFESYCMKWDVQIKKSLQKLFEVEQPLLPLLDPATRKSLDEFFQNPEHYQSIYALKQKK